MVNALLIEFDLNTGKRAGNINPRDSGLKCYGWQNLDEEDINSRGYVWKSNLPKGNRALEIRIIEDGRDISQYENIDGVTVLRGKDEINEAIDKWMPKQYTYTIANQVLFQESLRQKNIDLSQFRNKKVEEILEELYEKHGVIGINKIQRFKKLL